MVWYRLQETRLRTLVWTWIVIHEGGFKNFVVLIFPDAKFIENLNTVELYDRRLLCSRSRGCRHMRRTSTAVAVERSDQLGELVSFGKSEDLSSMGKESRSSYRRRASPPWQNPTAHDTAAPQLAAKFQFPNAEQSPTQARFGTHLMFPRLEETFVRAPFNPRRRRPIRCHHVTAATRKLRSMRPGWTNFSHPVTIAVTATGTTRKTAHLWRLHGVLPIGSVKIMPLPNPWPRGLWFFACCNCVFEPRQGHKYLSPLNVVYCNFAMADPSTRGDLPSVCVTECDQVQL
jgi:hypothetical protein